MTMFLLSLWHLHRYLCTTFGVFANSVCLKNKKKTKNLNPVAYLRAKCSLSACFLVIPCWKKKLRFNFFKIYKN